MFNPRYTITPKLLRDIKDITVLVHELNRQVIPEVVLMHRQAEARSISTYASTSIEGNPLPLTDVKRLLKNQPAHLRHSEREVVNYNNALSALNEQRELILDGALLLRIHAGVMDGLLPAHQTGRFRQEPVVIREPRSGDIIFLPPDHQDVPALIEELVAFVRENQGLDPLLMAGLFHKQLVIIHPFMDGNGRTTRLATSHLLNGLGLRLMGLFSFENYYNRNVSRYFQMVGASGNYYDLANELDFTPWLEYFAEGILDELQRVGKDLAGQRTPETNLNPHDRLILAHIDAHGYINDKEYARLTERAKATRTLDFNRLIHLGLIKRQGKGRNTHYIRADEP
ncbi:MAG: Fic family protein [Candidatus Promineofilum sp.]|nr:Fic family protein [Promineifilum sp.]